MNPLNTIKKREEVEHKGQMTYNPVSVKCPQWAGNR